MTAATDRFLIGRAIAEQRFDIAITHLAQLLAAEPDDANSWYNLGFAHRMRLQPHAALAAYDRALAAKIDQPETVHLNKAAIEADLLHDPDAARASLAAALELNPAFVIAWLNKGQLEEDSGHVAAARAAYKKALDLSPGLGRAHARLAAIDVFEGQPQLALDRLAATATSVATTTDVFEMDYAAAAAHDALGDYDAAFHRAAQANVLQQGVSKLIYNRAGQARQVDALIGMFPAEPPAMPGPGELRPLIICGLFRSGSTLLETLLNRRLGIKMGGELDFTPWFVLQNGAALTTAGRDDFVAAYRRGYTDFCRTVLGNVDQFTDKRMDNFLYLGLIKRAFPAAKIIHTVRNPIDNFLSMYFLPFADSLTYANDFDDMLHFYRQYRRLMAHWEQCFGDDIITVRYEDLVADPDAVLAALAGRLGLTAAPREPDAGEQIIRTASVWQVRQPVHARSSGRWRHYAGHIGELATELEREFPEFSR